MNRRNVSYVQGAKCCGPFVKIQVERRKLNHKGRKRVGKQVVKSLGPSSRNNGSQAHEINKWALRR